LNGARSLAAPGEKPAKKALRLAGSPYRR
jgi:hypothetical protein